MRTDSFVVASVTIANVLCFCVAGCGNNNVVRQEAEMADTLCVADTLPITDEILVEEEVNEVLVMPANADELFDDFFFNFATSAKLQMKRISFPLTIMRNDSAETILPNEWETDNFFMNQDFYTLIFDDRAQMALTNDTLIDNVSIEKIYLNDSIIKRYMFERVEGSWYMNAIKYEDMGDSRDASFLKFYRNFSVDSLFQIQSINNPLEFIEANPEDELDGMGGFIAPEQWPSFAPFIPTDMIYNIIYGAREVSPDRQKIFVIRGISNGFETELTFKHRNGRWKLTKLTM